MNTVNVPPAIERLERELGITVKTVALALDVERRTVERWRDDRSAPRGANRERLSELVVTGDMIMRMFGAPETAQQWIRARSRYLGGLTPLQVLMTGRFDRVRADLEGLAGGVYL